MSTKKLFISDLDGTLLNDVPALSKFSLNNLNRLLENDDFHFTIATARSYFSAKSILKDLQLKLPIITFNGAFISNFNTGEHYNIFDIEKKYLNPLMNIISDANCHTFISAYSEGQDLLYYNETPNDGMQWFLNDRIIAKDPRLKKSGDLDAIFKNEILNIIIIDKFEVIEQLSKHISKKYGNALYMNLFKNQYDTEYYWLTINYKDANKGKAVEVFCEQQGFKIENTVCFGDNINDIEMLKVAGIGICPNNAIEKAKTTANIMIGSNEEDAIVKHILQQLK